MSFFGRRRKKESTDTDALRAIQRARERYQEAESRNTFIDSHYQKMKQIDSENHFIQRLSMLRGS